jgi:alpha-beta hydrolase superfamily lysophospholipase
MDLYHEGYNIYTVDLPNHGLNIDFDRQFLFLDYIRFCKGYVNLKNKKKVILIGHSMGGGIVSAISHQIKNLKAVVLLDPLQKGAKAHKAKRLLASIFNKELHEKVKN